MTHPFANDDNESAGSNAEWVVTFGDMMALLLTFFIMLYTLSNTKEDENFQAMLESIRQQFGYNKSAAATTPGPVKPRNSQLDKQTSQGRAKRFDVLSGGDKVKAPVGDYKHVQIVRPGARSVIGTAIPFASGQSELNEQQREVLRELVVVIRGKPQKIEIRGHASRLPDERYQVDADLWELTYRRSRNTMDYLVDQLGIDPQRIRIGLAAAHEPVHLGVEVTSITENGRVEVFLLDELTDDLIGTPQSRGERILNLEQPQ